MDRKKKTYVIVPDGRIVTRPNNIQAVVSPGDPVVSGDSIYLVREDYNKLTDSNLERLPFPFEHKVRVSLVSK